MKDLAFELPLNRVSFGNISILLLRTLFEQEKTNGKNYNISLFNIGPVELNAQTQNQEFNNWIQEKLQYGLENYNRDIPIFKLWHLNGGLTSFSKKQTLLSFYELDAPTPAEVNTAKNNKTLFTSSYTCEVFKTAGVSTSFIPLGFDSFNFKTINKKYHDDDRIVFNIVGKFEKRKGHVKSIQSWIKKYANNPKYALQCTIYNPFLNEQQNQQLIVNILQGQQKPYNVNFYPHMTENILYNDYLNSGDITVGMGTESWNLPCFHSVAMGKHAVLLNCNGHKDWANKDNSVLVNPNGKETAVDGMFFQPKGNYNLGNIFTFSEDELINGYESAIKRVEISRINNAGLDLQKVFTKERFLTDILNNTF